MESSTARWSIPGKSISFNEGAEEKKNRKSIVRISQSSTTK
jgi:ribosomal protein L35AE/L33A